ncbi:signal recognition particle 9 kDa protein-domain-containing protein [Scheffersomyces coipomensis]|uniref:signal recognition particle 9 kDa protein-domain-containing protein n=1 Tax=Scheffersomyces coipomensis TaxID=1788519 RepID=UPI00315CF8EB
MPVIKNIDSFIELATDLLVAYPNTTLLSITYTNVSKKNKKKSESSSGVTKKSNASNCVNIKLYEPNAGKTHKYKTYKIKELSRLLTFIGPRGVNIGGDHMVGLSSIMSNVKYDESKEIEDAENEIIRESTPAVGGGEDVGDRLSPVPVSKSTKSKSKNKKKKKKN